MQHSSILPYLGESGVKGEALMFAFLGTIMNLKVLVLCTTTLSLIL